MENTEFAAARSAAEATLGKPGETSATEIPTRLQALLATEEARVADAFLLAEVLAPLIAAQIASTPAAVAGASLAREPRVAPAAPSRPPVARQRDDPAPSIADLIDGMLGQERRDHSPST